MSGLTWLLAASLLLAASDAEEPGSTPEERREASRLEAIRAEIESLRGRLIRDESEAGTLLDQLDDVGLKLALLERETQVLEAEIRITGRQAEQARAEARLAARRAGVAERELRVWLVEMYKLGPERGLSQVLATSSPVELASAERAAEMLAREEARRVGALRSERSRMETAALRVEASQARLEKLAADLEARRSDFRTVRASKSALLKGVVARQSQGEQALLALVQMERDLQALLDTLPGEGPEAVRSYGLPRFRGLLNWPVTGPVTIPFGNVRHPKFATQVPHPGLEIGSPAGEPVRALFDGRVAFSDWFRGYGQMIVIDHGDEYLSIYGQLGERLAAAGQEVRRDEPIARIGGEGTFGMTGLYLEIRHRGEALDPSLWLRKSSGMTPSRVEKR